MTALELGKPHANPKAERIINYTILVGAPFLLLAFWQAMGTWGYINVSILSTPEKIWEAIVSYATSGMLLTHFLASLRRVAIGFVIGAATGVILGILMGLFPKFRMATAVILGVIRPIPMVGLSPLFVLWFGIGELSKILVIAIGALWPVLLNVDNGIQGVDKKHLEVAQSLKKSRATVLRRIVLPSAIPSLLTGLRLGLSNGWRGIVAAEMIGASRGVGYMISYARELSQPAVMFTGLLIIGIVGILIDSVLIRLQRRLLRWA